jgi:hypothetical protein
VPGRGRPAIERLIGCYDRVERDDLLSPFFPGVSAEAADGRRLTSWPSMARTANPAIPYRA